MSDDRPPSPSGLLTIADCLARIPPAIRMSERTFRRLVRLSGRYMEHRRKLMLTEADLAAVLDTLRPPAAATRGKPVSRASPPASSEVARALERIRAATEKVQTPPARAKRR